MILERCSDDQIRLDRPEIVFLKARLFRSVRLKLFIIFWQAREGHNPQAVLGLAVALQIPSAIAQQNVITLAWYTTHQTL